MTTEAGWFPDPQDPTIIRYWDGAAWGAERVWDGHDWVAQSALAPPPPSAARPAPPPPAATQPVDVTPAPLPPPPAQATAPVAPASAVPPPPAAATQPVPVTPAPEPESTSSKRPVSVGAIVALGLVATLIAAGVTYLIVKPDDEKTAELPRTGGDAGQTQNLPAATPSSTTTTTAPAEVRLALVEMEGLLNDSGAGRRNLNDVVLGPFTNCALSAESAASQMDGVIANRQRILNGAAALAQRSDTTVRELGSLLRQAIQFSLDSNYQYQSWMNDNTGYSCPRVSTPNKVAGDESSGKATTAKDAFVHAYNPVAAGYGMRSDSDVTRHLMAHW